MKLTYTLTAEQAQALRVLRNGAWRETKFFACTMQELEVKGLARTAQGQSGLLQAQISRLGVKVLKAINAKNVWSQLSLSTAVPNRIDSIEVDVLEDA